MSDDLNIRAANVLDLVLIDGIWCCGEKSKPDIFSPYFMDPCEQSLLVREADLKFITSYDWAMLGVKYIIENIKPQEGYSVMATFHTEINMLTGKWFNNDWWDWKPVHITEAWVKVLEKNNE